MSAESQSYKMVLHLAATLDDETLRSILERTNMAISLLEDTDIYIRIESDIREGNGPPFDSIRSSIDSLEKKHPEIDYNTALWLVGLRFASSFEDVETLTIQFALFVASQRFGQHRIADDKIRLIVTYLHMTLLKFASL